MSCLLIAVDLLQSSKVQASGQRLGVPVVVCPSGESALAQPDLDRVKLVVIDLGTPGLDIPKLVPAISAACGAASVIAFGPHVQADLLESARQAGCDQVLPRGAFVQQIDELLIRFGRHSEA